MSEGIRTYLLELVASALVCAILMTLTPEGAARRMVRLGCGLLMLLCAMQPVIRFDAEDVSRLLARIEMQQDAAISGVQVKNRELIREIISDKAEAYILDKARALGLSIAVLVEAKDDGGGPYLYSVTYTGSAEEGQKAALEDYVEEQLAIRKERQIWRSS